MKATGEKRPKRSPASTCSGPDCDSDVTPEDACVYCGERFCDECIVEHDC